MNGNFNFFAMLLSPLILVLIVALLQQIEIRRNPIGLQVVIGGIAMLGSWIIALHFAAPLDSGAALLPIVRMPIPVHLILACSYFYLLSVYVLQGTIPAAQTALGLIIAVLIGGLILPLLASLGRSPFLPPIDAANGLRPWLAGVTSYLVGLYILPVTYQGLVNRWLNRTPWLALLLALLNGEVVRGLFFALGGYWNVASFENILASEWIGAFLTAATAGPLLVAHIASFRKHLQSAFPETSRATLGMIEDTLDLRTALERSEHRVARLNETLRLLTEGRRLIVRAAAADRLLQEIVNLLVSSHQYPAAWIGLTQPGETHIQPAARAGNGSAWITSIPITWDESDPSAGPSSRALQSGKLVVYDQRQEKSNPTFPEINLPPDLYCFAVVPLMLNDRPLGVLITYKNSAQEFDPEELRMLQGIAVDLAHGLSRLHSEEQRSQRMRELEAVRQLSLEVISEISAGDLLQTVLLKASKLLAGAGGAAYLFQSDSPDLQPVAFYDPNTKNPDWHTALELEHASRVAQNNGPLIDRLPAPEADSTSTKSIPFLSVPLFWNEAVIGVLQIWRDPEQSAFKAREGDLLSLFANQATVALENNRLLESTRTRLDQFARLNEITRACLSSEAPEQIAEILANNLGHLIGADGCFITFWDAEKQVPTPKAASNEHRQSYALHSVLPGEPNITASTLQAGHTLLIPDLMDSPYVSKRIANQFPSRSMMALPLRVHDQPLGAALIAFDQPHVFGDEEISICEQAAAMASLALAHAKAIENEKQRNAELEALREASLNLTSSLELEPILEAVIRHALLLVDADDAHIFHWDGDQLTFGAAMWAGEIQHQPHSQPRRHGITSAVAMSGEQIVVNDVRPHPLFTDAPWDGSIAAFPLRIGERVLGVMNIAFENPHHFDDKEIRVLQLLADQAAIAVQNGHLYEQTASDHKRFALLYEFTRAISINLDPDEILQRAVELTFEYLEGWYSVAYLAEQESDRLLLHSFNGPATQIQEALLERVDFRLGQGLIGWCAQHRQPVLSQDFKADPRAIQIPGLDELTHSAILTPILYKDSLRGVLGVFHQKVDAFQLEHLDMLQAIGQQLALALSNAERYQQLERQVVERTAIQHVAQTASRRLETQPLLEEVVHQIGLVLNNPSVEIYLSENGRLVRRASNQTRGAAQKHSTLSQQVIESAVREDQPIYLAHSSASGTDSFDGSQIAVPLHKSGQIAGALNVLSKGPRELTQGDLRLLNLLADQLSVAIENAALYERLQHHAAELEGVVAERTAELKLALAQAQQADQLKSQFVTDVSHELRTPLSNIRLYLELLVEGRSDRIEQYLETLNRETDRLVALIEDLLAISRLDTGEVSIETRPIDLNTLTRVLVHDRQRLCAGRQIDLRLEQEQNLPLIKGDEITISQAFANILTNAMNYTPPGGEIRVLTSLEWIDSITWVCLTVRDTGLGIPSEELDQLFERFFRGSASRELGVPGTGLGLAICKEIVDRNQGQIRVKSKPGNGSAFSILFPAQIQESGRPPSEPQD